MRVLNSIQQRFNEKYADPKFKAICEQNIDFALLSNNYTTRTIDPHLAYTYQGNLYGLYSALGISTEYQGYTAYLNGYKSPYDFDGKNLVMKVLPESVIDRINQIYF